MSQRLSRDCDSFYSDVETVEWINKISATNFTSKVQHSTINNPPSPLMSQIYCDDNPTQKIWFTYKPYHDFHLKYQSKKIDWIKTEFKEPGDMREQANLPIAALALALLLFSTSSSLALSSLFCLSSIILVFSIFWQLPRSEASSMEIF